LRRTRKLVRPRSRTTPGQHPDLGHPVHEGVALEVARLQGGDDDLLDRGDDPDHQEGLGHELALPHRRPDGAEELDEDEDEQQPVEGDGDGVERAAVELVDELVGDGDEGEHRGHDEQHAHHRVDDALADVHRTVDPGGGTVVVAGVGRHRHPLPVPTDGQPQHQRLWATRCGGR
jgi:hypothetical protein